MKVCYSFFLFAVFLLSLTDVASPRKSYDRKLKNQNTVLADIIQPATCEPENRSMSLLNFNYDSTYQYHPRYALVERCGGCCDSEVMKCQNTSAVPLNFLVKVFIPRKKASGEWKMTSNHTQVVTVYQHEKCKCDCRNTPEDCQAKNLTLNRNNCECAWKNKSDVDKCPSNNQKRDAVISHVYQLTSQNLGLPIRKFMIIFLKPYCY